MTLAETLEGQTVKVEKITGSVCFKRRLMELGLIRGVKVRVERFAPLRDPIQVRVKGTSLALRISEGKMIMVSPEETE